MWLKTYLYSDDLQPIPPLEDDEEIQLDPKKVFLKE